MLLSIFILIQQFGNFAIKMM